MRPAPLVKQQLVEHSRKEPGRRLGGQQSCGRSGVPKEPAGGFARRSLAGGFVPKQPRRRLRPEGACRRLETCAENSGWWSTVRRSLAGGLEKSQAVDGPKKPPAGRSAPRFAPPAKRVGASAAVAFETTMEPPADASRRVALAPRGPAHRSWIIGGETGWGLSAKTPKVQALAIASAPPWPTTLAVKSASHLNPDGSRKISDRSPDGPSGSSIS